MKNYIKEINIKTDYSTLLFLENELYYNSKDLSVYDINRLKSKIWHHKRKLLLEEHILTFKYNFKVILIDVFLKLKNKLNNKLLCNIYDEIEKCVEHHFCLENYSFNSITYRYQKMIREVYQIEQKYIDNDKLNYKLIKRFRTELKNAYSKTKNNLYIKHKLK